MVVMLFLREDFLYFLRARQAVKASTTASSTTEPTATPAMAPVDRTAAETKGSMR